MGAHDPRLNPHGNLDLRLNRQLRSYRREDPPPKRVKPIPIGLLLRAAETTRTESRPTQLVRACCDMMIIGFFFLMRSGEYATSNETSHPFHLQDVEFYVSNHRLNTMSSPPAALQAATFVLLEFTTQKNATRGEKIGHSCSRSPFFCPVEALARRVL